MPRVALPQLGSRLGATVPAPRGETRVVSGKQAPLTKKVLVYWLSDSSLSATASPPSITTRSVWVPLLNLPRG